MIITVGGIKGGSGKTTVATNLAVIRANDGRDVLLIDADDQETASGKPYNEAACLSAPVTVTATVLIVLAVCVRVLWGITKFILRHIVGVRV